MFPKLTTTQSDPVDTRPALNTTKKTKILGDKIQVCSYFFSLRVSRGPQWSQEKAWTYNNANKIQTVCKCGLKTKKETKLEFILLK